MLTVDWTTFKSITASSGMLFKYYQLSSGYYVFAADGPFGILCCIDILETPSADQTDFETNYKAKASSTLNQFDSDGAMIVRNKAAHRGWTFMACPVELQTSTLNSLVCQDSTGANRGWATYTILDASGTPITDSALQGNAVKTYIDFEPPFDYEVIGGTLHHTSVSGADARLWVIAAPDIPASLGGSKEMAGGLNLKFIPTTGEISIDGRVAKLLTYSATTHSSKLRFLLEHAAGYQNTIMIVVEFYRE